jgi:hypothetical protein
MAGGTWIDQNKVLPGVYINYSSAPSTLATMGERGVVCIGKQLSWANAGHVIVINDPSECFDKLGYDQLSDELIWLRQLLVGTNRTSGASKILVWPLGVTGATEASATESDITTPAVKATLSIAGKTATAKEAGLAGNSLAIAVTVNSGDSSKFDVTIYNGADAVETNEAIASTDSITSALIDFVGENAWNWTSTAKTNLSGGADAVIGASITATAKYAGVRGNDITVVITADPDNDSIHTKFYVQTLVSGKVVDNQVLEADSASVDWSGLVDSDWVKFSNKTGNVFAINATLSGGTDGSLSATAYSDFMTAMELNTWNVIVYGGSDAVTKSAIANYVKRLANDEGKKVQAVISNYPSADNECVISVYPQNITLITGHQLTDEEMACWVAGCSAGANVNESLTYSAHPDAAAINPVLSQSQQIEAINAGQFALFEESGAIKVIQDINTFLTFAATKGKQFRKNRVIRVLFGLCNDIYRVFAQYYVGNTHNDESGRNLLKAEILNLMNRYQGNRALQNVVVDDVTVNPGEESDAVVIEVYAQPVDSIEKIYINITIA